MNQYNYYIKSNNGDYVSEIITGNSSNISHTSLQSEAIEFTNKAKAESKILLLKSFVKDKSIKFTLISEQKQLNEGNELNYVKEEKNMSDKCFATVITNNAQEDIFYRGTNWNNEQQRIKLFSSLKMRREYDNVTQRGDEIVAYKRVINPIYEESVMSMCRTERYNQIKGVC